MTFIRSTCAGTGLLAALTSAALAASPRVVLTPAPGYGIGWDGNNGGFSSPDAGAGPSNNVALASNGTVAFTSSDLGPVLNLPFHLASNLNDGLYGNSHSWISANGTGGTGDPDPFAGLSFVSAVNLSSIAWSRDNGDAAGDCCGGTLRDRTLGIYTLQYTSVSAPDNTTSETEDAATGWATLGSVEYTSGADDSNFSSYLRHRFDVSRGGKPIAGVTGIRIKVSDGSIAIDEIEVNPMPDPVPPLSTFLEVTPNPGFSITWDGNEGLHSSEATPALAPVNDASSGRGSLPFGSSELSADLHFISNVNDGLYGNTHSWIPEFRVNPDPNPFIGILFGKRIQLRNITWGRDNGDVRGDCCGGTLTDRALGQYILQVTTDPNPGPLTPDACGSSDSGWVTVGTVDYKSDDPKYFNSHLRHRFDVSQNGDPIPATAIRILVPNNRSAIDEIEVNANAALEQGIVRITNGPGVKILWDGNDGQFADPSAGAAAPENRALSKFGTLAFTSSDLGPSLGLPFHVALNLNDGLYGNTHSWISANGTGLEVDSDPFAALAFGSPVVITNIAWSRDNGDVPGDCCGGTLTDRAVGTYRLQYTQTPLVDISTAETGDAATGWAELGTVAYTGDSPGFFTKHLRHRFDLLNDKTLQVTGIRIKVSSGKMDIDEIEVNTPVAAPQPAVPVVVTPARGYLLAWDGNNGQFQNTSDPALVPANRALASAGTTAFTSSDLGPILQTPFHLAGNLNDGLYGDANSWISANGVGGTTDTDPFAGLSFGGSIQLRNIAWGRDNGPATDVDRALGVYTVQFTQVPAPDAGTPDTGNPVTGWTTLGTVEYRLASPPEFWPHLRHRFDVSQAGNPIPATGIRIKVSSGAIAMDEIEVNTLIDLPAPVIAIARSGNKAVLSWSNGGGLEVADRLNGPWTCLGAAGPGWEVSLEEATIKFYRIRR